MNSIDTRFSRNVFEAAPKTRSTYFIGFKTTQLCLVVLKLIKHSCSFFKHYTIHPHPQYCCSKSISCPRSWLSCWLVCQSVCQSVTQKNIIIAKISYWLLCGHLVWSLPAKANCRFFVYSPRKSIYEKTRHCFCPRLLTQWQPTTDQLFLV